MRTNHKKTFYFLLALFLLISTNIALSKEKSKFNTCIPTKTFKVAEKPITYDNMLTYIDNNTTRDPGDLENNYVDKIYLRGMILDKKCTPIPNASIEIWQNDEYGKKRYKGVSYSFQDRYNLNQKQYSTFSGIATATSDNNGYFTFVTVTPNSKAQISKKHIINISVKHNNFPKIQNQILIDSEDTAIKPRIIAYNNTTAGHMYGLPTYDFEVIMDGKTMYKSY